MHDVFVELIGIGIGCTNGEHTGEEHKLDKTFTDIVREVTLSLPSSEVGTKRE